MQIFWRYLSYMTRHRWFVFVAACKLGIPLRGLLHDLSKFRPDEYRPYSRYFYGRPCKPRDEWSGFAKLYFPEVVERECLEAVEEAFDRAWLAHQHRNAHHWQHHILREDDGGMKLLEMPLADRKEMLADWIGCGQALGKPDTRGWYLANRQNMLLAPGTRRWIEDALDVPEDDRWNHHD
jgi:hypothetical protein